MKQQIARLSPHQNAKVAAVVWAIISLIFVIPMSLSFLLVSPQAHGGPFAGGFFLIMPVIYLIFGYLFTAFACWIYNLLVKYIGGFEYEARDAGPGA